MSTYIDPRKLNLHSDYKDCPEWVVRYLYDAETIRGLSPRTINGYYIDLRTFFRFLKRSRALVPANTAFNEIVIQDIDLAFLSSVTTSEIYEYLYYATRERENNAAARARKLSSVNGFFKYMCHKQKLLETNPAEEIDTPALKKSLPKYLTFEESLTLLQSVNSDFFERDYCILTLFLNCGMRLSELVNINITDLRDDDTIRIIGKGNKERIIYLNKACQKALRRLCDARAKLLNLQEKEALFVSKRTGKRLSPRRVQQLVSGCLQTAGLSGKGYSVHKLRHTAATMMYQKGHVDMLELKEILGHAHVSTTEIYTHLGAERLKEAADASPFASLDVPNAPPAAQQLDPDAPAKSNQAQEGKKHDVTRVSSKEDDNKR